MRLQTIIVAGLMVLCNSALADVKVRNACEFSDIKEFVEWFKGSENNQKSATANPLEAAFDEYDEKGKKLPMAYEPHTHDELGWPILPRLGKDFREVFIEHDKDTVTYQTIGGMAYKHTYLFKRAPCWKLVKFTHDRI